MLITIDNVLSKDEVRQFRGYLDQAEWRDGADSAGAQARKAKSNQQVDDQAEVALSLGQHVLRSLASHPRFISAALPRQIYPPKFNRYANGAHYGTHIDSALLQLPGTGASLRSDLSATLFLAEPGDYDGASQALGVDRGHQAPLAGQSGTPFAADTNIDTKQYDAGVNYIIEGYNAQVSAVYSKTKITSAGDLDKFAVALQLQY